MKSFTKSLCVLAAWAACGRARADVYRWEYVNPNVPSQGKRQSSALVPDGAGAALGPGADLSHRNLAMAYLPGVDARGADLIGANLTSAYFDLADLSGANLSGAVVRGATFLRDSGVRPW